MAVAETWIANKLLEDTAVAAVVSSRVYPVYAPQNALFPFITYQRVNTKRQYTTSGSDSKPVGAFMVRVWDRVYSDCKGTADLVRAALNKKQEALTFTGDDGEQTAYIRSSFLTDERDIDDFPPLGNETPYYGVELTFDITFTE